MSCPTCDCTMQRLDTACPIFIFWCPRCGTLKTEGNVPESEAPMLVDRCRKFGETLGPSWRQLWHMLGIEESIALPLERTAAHGS